LSISDLEKAAWQTLSKVVKSGEKCGFYITLDGDRQAGFLA